MVNNLLDSGVIDIDLYEFAAKRLRAFVLFDGGAMFRKFTGKDSALRAFVLSNMRRKAIVVGIAWCTLFVLSLLLQAGATESSGANQPKQAAAHHLVGQELLIDYSGTPGSVILADTQVKCVNCNGSGKCPDCNGGGKCRWCVGSGKVRDGKPCPLCNGSGNCAKCVGTGTCPICKGTGIMATIPDAN